MMVLRLRKGVFAVLGGAAILVACHGGSPSELISSAKQALARGDNSSAIIQLKNALQVSPDLAEARFLLGKATLDSGDAAYAIEQLRRALGLGYPLRNVLPPLARALILDHRPQELLQQYAQTELAEATAQADLKTSIAVAKALQGDVEGAQTALALALRAVADYPPALRLQARLLADEHHVEAAIALIDKLLATDPQDSEAWYLKGEFLLRGRNDVASALDAYRHALDIRKDFAPARISLIALLLAKRDLNSASAELELQRKALPNDPRTLYFDAELAFSKGDLKNAHEITQRLLNTTPDSVKLLQLAGAVDFNMHLLQESERSLSKAVRLAPDQPVARRLLAQTYLRLGQPNKALATLEPLITVTARDAKAAALAAEANLQSGDLVQAQANYSKAAHLDPHDVKSRVVSAMGQLNTANAGAAFADLASIASDDPGIYANLALVSAYIQRKDFAAASKGLDEIEAKQPNKPFAASLRGQVYLMRTDAAQARRSFERAVTIDPAYLPAAASLARLDLADKHPEMATKRFETVLAADPGNLEAQLAIIGIRAKAGASSDEIAGLLANAIKLNPTADRPRVQLVDHLLLHHDTEVALATAQVAATAIPGSASALDALGRAQMAAGEINQAIESFDRLAALDPKSPVAHMRLASAYLATNDIDAAIHSVNQALETTPDIPAAQRLLVDLELAAKRPQEALLVAKAVQKKRPEEALGYLLEAAVDVARKNLAAAAEIYGSVLKKFPSTAVAIKLHSVLEASAKSEQADKVSASWLLAHPGDPGFLFYLGEASLAKRNYSAAEAFFHQVLRATPNDAAALNNVAWIMTRLKEPGAVDYAQKAARLAPKAPAYLDTLAGALAAENKVRDAVDAQRKATALAPGNLAFRLHLAKIYIRSGDKVQARSELETLSRAGQNGAVRDEVDVLLKTL